MRTGRKTVVPLPVLRNVVVQELPHALTRPRRGAVNVRDLERPVALALETVHLAQSRSYEEGVAAGYHEGLAAGQAAQRAESQALLDEIGEEARAKGFSEGHAEGLRQGSEESAEMAQQLRLQLIEQGRASADEHKLRFEQMALSLSKQSGQLAADAEDDLVAMSFEVVCRLLGERAATTAGIRSMVEQLLAQRAIAGLAVHVHPEDLQLLRAESGEGVPQTSWQWVADDKVQLGGVILRSPNGNLDARLEVQLETLRQTLLQARQGRRG